MEYCIELYLKRQIDTLEYRESCILIDIDYGIIEEPLV